MPAPEAQLLPPGPPRPVSLNSTLTKGPRWAAETNSAPHGSAALAISAWVRLRIVIAGPGPSTNTLGILKYRAAAPSVA